MAIGFRNGGRNRIKSKNSRRYLCPHSHLKNCGCITCFQRECFGLYNQYASAFWQLADPHFLVAKLRLVWTREPETAEQTLSEARGYTGTRRQHIDSSSVPGAHDEVGLRRNMISKCYKTTFLIPMKCSEELKQRTPKSARKSPFT